MYYVVYFMTHLWQAGLLENVVGFTRVLPIVMKILEEQLPEKLGFTTDYTLVIL